MLQFPTPEWNKEPEPSIPDMPEGTVASLGDPGWIAAAMLVTEIASQIFGSTAAISAIPDPEGWHQDQAGKQDGTSRPGVYVEISSRLVPIGATMVIPFEIEAYGEIRTAMAELMVQLRGAEQAHMNKNKLVVPEKKLYIPGQD